ncbi:MAG TPA: hypothetical protein VFB60_20395 [Ktedonobacteraceae bacterium]|nr:hypothetical protein [Ktedonobacteraceae bacterium]
MFCQLQCSNIGKYRCGTCGKLVCEQHVHMERALRPRYEGSPDHISQIDYIETIQCVACYQQQREETIAHNYQLLAAKQEKEAKESKGCYTALIGGAAVILGIIIDIASGGGSVGGSIFFLLLVGGLLTGIIGVIIFLSSSD